MKYKVASPEIPAGRTTPILDALDIENWLNSMDADGWVFVGFASKYWNSGYINQWWIFHEKEKP
jgi:hypothetical protein